MAPVVPARHAEAPAMCPLPAVLLTRWGVNGRGTEVETLISDPAGHPNGVTRPAVAAVRRVTGAARARRRTSLHGRIDGGGSKRFDPANRQGRCPVADEGL